VTVTIEPAFATQIQNAKTHHFANLYTVTRADGTIHRFTDHNTRILFNSYAYKPTIGFMPSAHQEIAGLSNDNFEVFGALDDTEITEEDLRGGRFRDAEVLEQLIDWRVPWLGAIRQRTYFMTEITHTEAGWVAQVEGLSSFLDRIVGNVTTRTCRHTLGDGECGVNLTLMEVTGTVTAITSAGTTFETDVTDVKDVTGSTISNTDQWFRHGTIEWDTGNNAGLIDDVKSSLITDGVATLWRKTRYDIQVGDTFTLTPGCNRSIEICRTKFDDKDNFGGRNLIPGTDKVLRTPNAK